MKHTDHAGYSEESANPIALKMEFASREDPIKFSETIEWNLFVDAPDLERRLVIEGVDHDKAVNALEQAQNAGSTARAVHPVQSPSLRVDTLSVDDGGHGQLKFKAVLVED